MKRSLLLVVLVFSFLKGTHLLAQDTIPKQFLTDLASYYQAYSKHDIPEDLIETYAQQYAYSKFNNTFYHKIYYQQPVLEDYIRSILKQLLPEKKEIKDLEVYITKSTQFNAFTISDGSIFVNIAALAQMSSEAELAFLLAHEYAHYKLKHGELSYKKKFSTKKKKPTIKELDEFNNFSQKNEMSSDSLALVLGTEAGYDARAMDNLLQKLIFLQKKQVLRFNESYNSHLVFPTSHPIGEERLLKLKTNNTISPDGSLFLLGEDHYNRVKKLAEYEYLKLLDEDFDLHQAISFPLKKYLITGNDIYLPTLVRAIRKLMVLIPDVEKKGFMITHFSNYEERFEAKENILHHLELEYPNSNEIAKMKVRNAINLKKVPFYSYKQAFYYLSKKAIAAGYSEPHLDIALYYGVKSSNGRASLKRYLDNPDNLYYEYALLLKKNKLLDDMEGREKILLIGGLSHYEYKKKKLTVDRIKDHENRNTLLTIVRNKYIEDSLHYKIYNYMDFYQESPLSPYLRTIEKLVYSGRSNMILTYDPRLYYAFKKANINSLEFMSIQHLNYKNQRWRTLLWMLPPLTLTTMYGLLTGSAAFASHINAVNYYACFIHDEKIYGKAFGEYKTGNMTDERAAKVMYKTHREQKAFYRYWGYIFQFKVKDRTEWRY